MRKPAAIKNLVVVSDLHVGCRLALCHPKGAHLDDGGRYMPSKAQLVIWAWWREFWDKYVPKVTRGEPYAVVVNGDVIDGSHHGATTQWSQSMGDQVRHAREILEPIVKRCGGRFYMIRGTEAHVGKSGVEEERLGRELGAVPDDVNQYSRYELFIRIGGQLVHLLHHIGTTGSAAYEASALNGELAAMYTDAGRWGTEPPRLIVRSHRHKTFEVAAPVADGKAGVVVTPCWQLKTPFAWKIPGARVTTPQIGGLVIRHGDEDALYTRTFVRSPSRTREVTL